MASTLTDDTATWARLHGRYGYDMYRLCQKYAELVTDAQLALGIQAAQHMLFDVGFKCGNPALPVPSPGDSDSAESITEAEVSRATLQEAQEIIRKTESAIKTRRILSLSELRAWKAAREVEAEEMARIEQNAKEEEEEYWTQPANAPWRAHYTGIMTTLERRPTCFEAKEDPAFGRWLEDEDHTTWLRWQIMPQWFVQEWKEKRVLQGKEGLPWLMRERERKGEVPNCERPNSWIEDRVMKKENEYPHSFSEARNRASKRIPGKQECKPPSADEPVPQSSKSERDEAIVKRNAAWQAEVREKELRDLEMGIDLARVKGWKVYTDAELAGSNMAYERRYLQLAFESGLEIFRAEELHRVKELGATIITATTSEDCGESCGEECNGEDGDGGEEEWCGNKCHDEHDNSREDESDEDFDDGASVHSVEIDRTQPFSWAVPPEESSDDSGTDSDSDCELGTTIQRLSITIGEKATKNIVHKAIRGRMVRRKKEERRGILPVNGRAAKT